jgi:hypothetical protein
VEQVLFDVLRVLGLCRLLTCPSDVVYKYESVEPLVTALNHLASEVILLTLEDVPLTHLPGHIDSDWSGGSLPTDA